MRLYNERSLLNRSPLKDTPVVIGVCNWLAKCLVSEVKEIHLNLIQTRREVLSEKERKCLGGTSGFLNISVQVRLLTRAYVSELPETAIVNHGSKCQQMKFSKETAS